MITPSVQGGLTCASSFLPLVCLDPVRGIGLPRMVGVCYPLQPRQEGVVKPGGAIFRQRGRLKKWTHRDLNPDLQHAELASSLWTMSPLSKANLTSGPAGESNPDFRLWWTSVFPFRRAARHATRQGRPAPAATVVWPW